MPEPVRNEPSGPRRFAIQYVGFHDTAKRREYELNAQYEDEKRRYTIWIELAAFSRRQAQFQDGPDICFRKLEHELATADLPLAAVLGVTDSDLLAYREAHLPPARRTAAKSAEPKKD